MSRLLEARALCAYYGPTQVLFGLDLGVEAGGITTLLGANGAGKTTTLRSLSGMCRTDGEIRFDGKPIAAARPRTSCGSASRMCRRAAARSRARPWRKTCRSAP